MAIEILMPALSPTMEEGTLAKWLVNEGDTVSSGDLLAEIETDKATMEFEAVDEGVIGKLLVAEGSAGVKVNSVIAILLDEGEALDEAALSGGATTAPSEPSQEDKLSQTEPTKQAEAPSTSSQATTVAGARIFASPLARRIAQDKGIDLSQLKGSGPHGRIVKADLEGARPQSVLTQQPSTPPLARSASADDILAMYQGRKVEEIALDGMRKTVAQRLTEAKQTIPHFYIRSEICLDPLLKMRSELNKALEKQEIKISVNDFIIKACAMALQEISDANSVWAGDRILRMTASDIAVAVAVEGGLFTPVIQDSETKTLSQLSIEMKDLATRARARKLKPEEYMGGSFAISNLGMYGIDNFDAVINPPHGAILAVGAGVQKPVVTEDGQLGIATMMGLTLSVDHRVIDGALGAELLNAIKVNLENPLAMLA